MHEPNAWRRRDGQPVCAHQITDEPALTAWVEALGEPLTFHPPAVAHPIVPGDSSPMVVTRDGERPAATGGFVTYDGIEFEVMGPAAFWLRHVNVGSI